MKPCWDLMEEWAWREPGKTRVPIPVDVVKAMLAVAGSWDWWGFGLLVWISFHGLLRPGEAVALRRKHVRFAHMLGSKARVAVLVIVEAKTRRKAARIQHVVLEEPFLVRVLEKFCGTLSAEDPLFPLSQPTFDKRFQTVLKALNLEHMYTPASLRTGGATEEWVRFRDIQALRLRGRWMQLRTLEHYVQEAVAMLGEEEIPFNTMEVVQNVAREAARVWEAWL